MNKRNNQIQMPMGKNYTGQTNMKIDELLNNQEEQCDEMISHLCDLNEIFKKQKEQNRLLNERLERIEQNIKVQNEEDRDDDERSSKLVLFMYKMMGIYFGLLCIGAIIFRNWTEFIVLFALFFLGQFSFIMYKKIKPKRTVATFGIIMAMVSLMITIYSSFHIITDKIPTKYRINIGSTSGPFIESMTEYESSMNNK